MASVGGRCAVCGYPSSVSHHVVYAQHLRPAERWATANVLPLCNGCHEAHHNGSRRIPVARLLPWNLVFAREVLGGAWEGYMERRYGGTIAERNAPAAQERPGAGQRELRSR